MNTHSSIIFVGPRDYCPIFASLGGNLFIILKKLYIIINILLETFNIYLAAVRDEIRNIACYNDQIKIALSARANELKRLEY